MSLLIRRLTAEAFEDMETYASKCPDAGYMRKLIGRDAFTTRSEVVT